jgi:manganese/zinc/iron transport system permease protein
MTLPSMCAATILGSGERNALEMLTRIVTFRGGHNTNVVLVGTAMLGLACGAVGTFLLLRRRALVADALSHAALPGVCVGFLAAVWLGWESRSLAVLLPSAALFGLAGVLCVHLLTRLPRVQEEAAIGVVLSVFFAIGVVLLGVIQNMNVANKAGLNHFIFGQAATMSAHDATLIAVLGSGALVACTALFKEMRLLCFDTGFAGSLGWNTFALDAALLGLVTTLTAVGLHAVGAILMVALLIIPPAAARFWTDRLTAMTALSAFIGGSACFLGSTWSALDVGGALTPTGPAIVLACGSFFVISMLLAPQRGLIARGIQRWRLARQVSRQHLLRAIYEQQEIAGRFEAPVRETDLLARRAWGAKDIHRIANRLRRRGELVRQGGALQLTREGRDAAETIVRTHRLWEHFLTTQADIAPSHVDRAADDIEHVLSEDLIRDLEDDLHKRGSLAEGGNVPASPHALRGAAQ